MSVYLENMFHKEKCRQQETVKNYHQSSESPIQYTTLVRGAIKQKLNKHANFKS